jgi:hypothetical protein
MLMDQSALFWLLDVKAHGFDAGVLKDIRVELMFWNTSQH